MKAKVFILILAFLGTAAGASSESGFGIAAGYPIGPDIVYSDVYGQGLDPVPIFAGPFYRWKNSGTFIDLGCKIHPHGGMIHGNMNIGLCGDLAFLRLGLSGGFDAVILPNPGSGSIVAFGNSAKVYIDVKIQNYSLGVSLELPMDMLGNLKTYGYAFVYPYDELRIYASQLSLNLIYWF